MVGGDHAGRWLVTMPFRNWVFVPAVTAMFFFGNGVGRIAELVMEPPYKSESVSVYAADHELCESALGNRNGDEWCVVEVRQATRYPDGTGFGELDSITSGMTECAGSWPLSVKPVTTRSFAMWLSAYVGQAPCRPCGPFVVRTVRVFDERIVSLGVTWGWARWRVESPISEPAG